MVRHARLSSLVLAASLPVLSQAQSAAQCVSTPGVDLKLLTACEQLQTQLSKQLTAGGAVDLSTAITYQVTSNGDDGNGGVTRSSSTAVLQTSAVVTSDGGALGGFGTGSSATVRLSGSGSSTAISAITNGISSSGLAVGAAATSGSAAPNANSNPSGQAPTGASGASSPSVTDGAASRSGISGPATAGQANAQGSNVPGLTQSSSNPEPHHYRNTVVIPVAVVCTVVPVILLAFLACFLVRRRRKRRGADDAVGGAGVFANSEKHDSWERANQGNGMTETKASAFGTGVGATSHTAPADPFTNAAVSDNGPLGAHAGHPSGIGSGTATGTGAALAASTGAAGVAARQHSQQSSTTGSMTSAYSQQKNDFHGTSGVGTPSHSTPIPTTQSAQHHHQPHDGSNVSPATAAAGATGVGILGSGWRSVPNPSRDARPAGTASTTRPVRPPTLPEMEPAMGSGTWFSGEYDDTSNRDSLQRDSTGRAVSSSSDYGVPREDLSDRYGSGVRSNRNTNYSRPSISASPRQTQASGDSVGDTQRTGVAANSFTAADDPFATPSTSTRVSHDQGSAQPPARSPDRSGVQQLRERPASPLDGSKAARVLGMDSGSGSATPKPLSPLPAQRQSTEHMTPSTSTSQSAGRNPWAPSSSVGEIRQGPYAGPAYQTPHVGPDDEATQPSYEQVTSYLSENEARAFDFNSGRPSGEQQRWYSTSWR